MKELHFNVVIDETLPSKVEDVVALGHFEGSYPKAQIYAEADWSRFIRDLCFGHPFAMTLAMRQVERPGHLLAIAVFLHRDLALCPSLPGLRAAMELADYGACGLAHVDRDVSRFIRLLENFYEPKNERVLTTLVGWIRDYLREGTLPSLPPELEPPRIVEIGTGGFVFATTTEDDLQQGWEELFRMGYLRGVLMQQVTGDRWRAFIARKSVLVALDLDQAQRLLNETETTLGEPAGWKIEGYPREAFHSAIWLKSPEAGTLILPSTLLKVLTHL